MRTIQEIIDNTGGFARLKRRPLRIDLGGHPTLVIQYLGKTGVAASDYLRVMRVEDIDGEISRVFEMSFECDEHGENWRAVVWHCELTGETRYVYTPCKIHDKRILILINLEELRALEDRAEAWDDDLFELGYLTVANVVADEDGSELSAAV